MTSLTVSCQAPLFMEFSRQEYRSGLPCSLPGDLHNPGTEPRSPALQADSLLSEPPGKPKNIGVGSLSLLQGIFLTQESNPSLPHFRQILYPLSYEGSPLFCVSTVYVQLLSHVRLCGPMDCSTGSSVLYCLPEFTQIHAP